MNVSLNGEILEEVVCFKYLGSRVAVDEGTEGELKFRMNEAGKVCGGMKRMFVSITLNECKEKTVQGISGEQQRRLNVMEMRCLRSMCRVI